MARVGGAGRRGAERVGQRRGDDDRGAEVGALGDAEDAALGDGGGGEAAGEEGRGLHVGWLLCGDVRNARRFTSSRNV